MNSIESNENKLLNNFGNKIVKKHFAHLGKPKQRKYLDVQTQ